MTAAPLKVAVVGHTNTGKTSLLRSLTRDVEFGEVSNRAATTRNVEAATLLVDGTPAMALFDTPGLEDSSGLLDRLGALREAHGGDWTDAIHWFLDHPADQVGFGQEAKAIGQLIACDIALYVVDARDRVHGKHRDELEILSRSARPILPVLNFVAASDAEPERWRSDLARVNMHAVAAFDTVVLDEVSERQLYDKMRTLLDGFADLLDRVIDDADRRRHALRRASAEVFAELLIDAAAYAVTVSSDDQARADAATEGLKQAIRDGEQDCVEALLDLHRFRPGDFLAETLPIENGRWGQDLFSPESLAEFGVATGGGAATGAVLGLAIDAMVGGITLGAAALTGGALGAVAGALGSRGRETLDSLRGYSVLRADTATLALLAWRQIALARALMRRGHASQDRLRLAAAGDNEDQSELWQALKRPLDGARHHGDWSRFNPEGMTSGSRGREALKNRLKALLVDALGEPAARRY